MSIEQLVSAHYTSELRYDAKGRDLYAAGLVDNPPSAFGLYFADGLEKALRKVISGDARDDETQAVIGWAIDAFKERGETTFQQGTDDWRKLARALASVQCDVLEGIRARNDGREIPAPTNSLLTKPKAPAAIENGTSTRIISQSSSKTLTELLPMFRSEKNARSGTDNEYQVAVRMFEEFLEEPRPVHTITRQDVLAYKRALMEAPANYSKRFGGMTLPDAIKANKARAKPFDTLNPTTINDKWLSRLRAILSWCVDNEIIPDNPAAGIKVDAIKSERPRVPFTPSDLAKIFSAPLFSPGKALGERQWMMLLALHTGFRASEIAQLRLDSIRHERGILVFAVEEETKNAASVRLTPAHSTLIALGLRERVAALRLAGETHLFPEWYAQGQAAKEATAKGSRRTVNQPFSQYHPRWFNRTYLRKSVGIPDQRKVFHSFRHTLKTALKRAGVSQAISDAITGHDDSSSGRRYEHDHAIEVLKTAIEKVYFDGLDLSGLISQKETALPRAHACL